MKFSAYSPAVNPNVMQNVPVRTSRDLHVYGPQGGGEKWKMLGQVLGLGMEMQQKVTDGKVMEANAEYNRLMSEGTSKLMQRKEGAALNISEDYDKLQRDVLGQVKEKYGGYIGFGAGQEAFNAYTMKDDATRRAGVERYQQAQTDAYRETQYNNQLAECRNTALEGGGRVEDVQGALVRMDAIVDSRFGEYGGEKLTEQKRLEAGKIVGAAVDMAIGNGDYMKAEQLLSTYRSVLPTNAYIDARAKVNKLQEIRQEYVTVDDIAANCRDVNGKIDLNRGREMIAAICGKDATRGGIADSGAYWDSMLGVETPYGRNGCVYAGVTLTAPYFRFAAEHKSETNVGNLFRAAQEEGSGAHVEKYTGQKANKGDIFVYVQPGDDPTNPDNLEHVMVSDGEGGTYGNSSGAADYVDENGNEVRGNGYIVHNQTQDVGNLDIAYIIRMDDKTDSAVSAYDPQKEEKLLKMLEAKARSENAIEKQQESAYKDNVMQQMQNAGSYEAAYDILINSGLPMDQQNTLDAAARRYYQVGRAGAASRGGGVPEDGEGPMWEGKKYNPKKHEKLFAQMDITFQNGKNPTAKQWVEMEEAADALTGSGIMTEENVAELTEVYQVALPLLTDYLDEGHSIPEAYELLLNSGTDPKIACIAIANVHRSYKAVGKAEPYVDEEDTGGTN